MSQQQPTGIHHIAIMAADIKKHIAFFADVVGFPLVALFDMHGVPGGLHAFLRMNDYGYFSIVQLPAVDQIPSFSFEATGRHSLHARVPLPRGESHCMWNALTRKAAIWPRLTAESGQ